MRFKSDLLTVQRQDAFAKIVSTIFVPPVFAFLTFLYLSFRFENTLRQQIIISTISFLFTFFLPVAYFLWIMKKKKIVNVDLERKEERTGPFMLGFLFLTIGLFFLIQFNTSAILLAFWIVYMVNSLGVVAINLFWKISIHAIGVAAPLALFVFDKSWLVLPLLIILFLVGWARVHLKCHSVSQIVMGSLLGFISTLFQLWLFLR